MFLLLAEFERAERQAEWRTLKLMIPLVGDYEKALALFPSLSAEVTEQTEDDAGSFAAVTRAFMPSNGVGTFYEPEK